MFRLQFILECYFALVKSTELVDLVLVFSPDLDFVACRSGLVFLGKLLQDVSAFAETSPLFGREALTMRRSMVVLLLVGFDVGQYLGSFATARTNTAKYENHVPAPP